MNFKPTLILKHFITSTDINKQIELGTAIRGQLFFGNHTQRNENIIKERVICPMCVIGGIPYQYTDRSFSFHRRRSILLLQNVLCTINPGGSLYYFFTPYILYILYIL